MRRLRSHALRRRYGRTHDSWEQKGRFERMKGQIGALAVQETLEIAPNGYVRKHKAGEYSLNDRANKERNRWGNLDQITGDALYYTEHGALPAPLGSRW